MAKVAFVLGTRPEAIKLSPLIARMRARRRLSPVVIATGQHREILRQALEPFRIVPDRDLAIMKPEQKPDEVVCACLAGLRDVFRVLHPSVVVVQGDTTSALAASLSAYYHRIPLAHVEAGLRTGDKYRPFPEEMNRVMIAAMADFSFAPTESAKKQLIEEGVRPSRIWVTGNTGIDALLWVRKLGEPRNHPVLSSLSPRRRLIVVTVHRRESFGRPLKSILSAVAEVARHRRDVEFVLPVHPNPSVRKAAGEVLSGVPRVRLVEPLDYGAFVSLMCRSFFIVTDSGGIQEEAPALGKPVLVVRTVTEREEAVAAGASRLVGTGRVALRNAMIQLLDDRDAYEAMRKKRFLFGDGKASERIIRVLEERFGGAGRSGRGRT